MLLGDTQISFTTQANWMMEQKIHNKLTIICKKWSMIYAYNLKGIIW